VEIKHIKCDKASFIVLEDIFDDKEQKYLWKEVDFLCDENKLQDPFGTGSDMRNDGTPKKSNKGLWISEYYSNNSSNYMSLYKKGLNQLSNQKDDLTKYDINLKLFFMTNFDSTLLSYYENEDYYESHIDIACYTYVFWLFKEPKRFSGGDLSFPELNYKVNVKSNMGVLFPSWVDHKVDKIEMYDKMDRYNSNGRFCFSTFFHIR
jgi:hypothetical protein